MHDDDRSLRGGCHLTIAARGGIAPGFPCRGPRPACPLCHPPAYLSHALARDALMLPGNADRRDLLRSVFGEWLERLVAETERKLIQRRYVRPPGALPEMGFLTACTRCGACV